MLSAISACAHVLPAVLRSPQHLDRDALQAITRESRLLTLRVGDVERHDCSSDGALSGVSLLLSGSLRAEYSGEVSCGVGSLGDTHLRHVLTPGDLVCGEEWVSSSDELRGAGALMPVQMRWNIPSSITALTPCRLLRFAANQTAASDHTAVLVRLVQDEIGMYEIDVYLL